MSKQMPPFAAAKHMAEAPNDGPRDVIRFPEAMIAKPAVVPANTREELVLRLAQMAAEAGANQVACLLFMYGGAMQVGAEAELIQLCGEYMAAVGRQIQAEAMEAEEAMAAACQGEETLASAEGPDFSSQTIIA